MANGQTATAGSVDVEALKRRIAELEAATAPKPAGVSFKVAPKGGMSMYLGGHYPVTLYADQWEVLLGAVDQIKAFLGANKATLKKKQ